MRHGDAEHAAGLMDAERRLTGLGELQAAAVGRTLADVVAGSGLFLSSPYTRAQQTTEHLLRAAGCGTGYEIDVRLVPGTRAAVLADALRQLGEPRLWLVSHMPLVGALVDWLVDGTGPLLTRLDPAEVVCLEAGDWLPGCASIAWRRHCRDMC